MQKYTQTRLLRLQRKAKETIPGKIPAVAAFFGNSLGFRADRIAVVGNETMRVAVIGEVQRKAGSITLTTHFWFHSHKTNVVNIFNAVFCP